MADLPIQEETVLPPSEVTHSEEEEVTPLNRRMIPPFTATVGRSIKLRDTFTLSGVVKTSSTVTTVSTDTHGSTQTDLAWFSFDKMEFHVGMMIRITAMGTITSDGTRTVTLRMGEGRANTTAWNTRVSTAAVANDQPWSIVWYGLVKTIGSAGTIQASWISHIDSVNKDSANTTTNGIALTNDGIIGLTAQWSATNAGNNIVIRTYIVEILY